MKFIFALTTLALLAGPLQAGCQHGPPAQVASERQTAPAQMSVVDLAARGLPALPAPTSNNAVATVTVEQGTFVVSFLGLGPGKTWRDTLSSAYQLRVGDERWQSIPDVPGDRGRLAGTAASLGGKVYVFGGYTVAEDGEEQSIPTVHAYDPGTGLYRAVSPMPVPVDDAVSLSYADRYIYLVSGWHDVGNVNLVQVYDTATDTWAQATPFPGTPVFGHAGGIVDNTMIVAGGVGIEVSAAGKRKFVMSAEAYIGRIDPENHRRIVWHRLQRHPGTARYRMAAVGTKIQGGLVVFAGGTDNPYNYNGIGYNGVPSEPSDRVFAYDVAGNRWRMIGRLPVATMDHRALLQVDGSFAIVGGMRSGQKVTADILVFTLPQRP